MKELSYDAKEVQNNLANEIGTLQLRLANEIASKKAVIKYAEELEEKLNEKENPNAE